MGCVHSKRRKGSRSRSTPEYVNTEDLPLGSRESSQSVIDNSQPGTSIQFHGEAKCDIPQDIACFLLRMIIPGYVMEHQDEQNKAGVFTEETYQLMKPSLLTQLPVREIRVAGSRAEGINSPKYYRRASDEKFEYNSDKDVMYIIDIDKLEYNINMEKIEESDNYTYLVNSVTGKRISHQDVVTITRDGMEQKGPASYKHRNDKSIHERVLSIPFPSWPHSIHQEWITRSRQGWPDADTTRRALVQPFCVVPVGRKDSPDYNIEWRFSFSLPEVVLLNSLKSHQRYAYRVVKLLYIQYFKHDRISSYFIKTIFLNLMESITPNEWNCDLLVNVGRILDAVICVFKNKYLPHYFIKTVNLISNLTYSDCECILLKIQKVRKNILKHVLDFDTMYRFNSCHTSALTSRVLMLNHHLTHPRDPCAWNSVTQQCLHTNMEHITSALLHYISRVRLPDTEDGITHDITPTLYWCHYYSRAAAYMVEEFCNRENVNTGDIVKWITSYIVKCKYDTMYKSIALCLVCLYVNHRDNGIHITMDTESMQEYREYLSSQTTEFSAVLTIFTTASALASVVSACVHNADFAINLFVFVNEGNKTHRISQQITKKSRRVVWRYLSELRCNLQKYEELQDNSQRRRESSETCIQS